MISFSPLDIILIVLFFVILIIIGIISSKNVKTSSDYILASRNVGLFLFVLVNVSVWYGGILGIGEFTYRYGLLNWLTQGLPYYIFAFLFAIFFAEKIRSTELYTIPDKIKSIYGEKNALLSALIVFIITSPAPYLLMSAILIQLIFQIDLFYSLLISFCLAGLYLIKGGFKATVYTDAFQFFVMFIGFIVLFGAAYFNLGGIEYLISNLPSQHLNLTGDTSVGFIVVWFLVALWTFADPGFHQRAYAAKNVKVAKWGIIISIIFWVIFDFLTTSTGLYARASLIDLENPLFAYPLLAEKILSSGFKGIFYIGMFATIISTLNSFLFLSATTLGKDFIYTILKKNDESLLKKYISISILISGVISIFLCLMIPSVVQMWYTIGSLFIPGMLVAVISSYYSKFKVDNDILSAEIIIGILSSTIWFLVRERLKGSFLYEIEPMIIGLILILFIHTVGLIRVRTRNQAE
ncbi:MAG: sodium:solute symporter family protein [Ignavibacterium sp.]|nr:sodium:solute symporter family protein [Ignavibacterium sp.]